MNLQKLKNLDYVEKKLLKIREILNPEDGYVICDAIIVSYGDELLAGHIKDMLKAMGYEKNIIAKVSKILKQIQ